MSQDESDFQRAMRKIAARRTFELDEEIANLRTIYKDLPSEQKVELSKWATMVADTKKAAPKLYASLSLSAVVSIQISNNEYLSANVPVQYIPEAIESWDKDEPFVPEKKRYGKQD